MIKVQESVPSIYYNSSRDFQLIGHLFDLVLNATKTDVDMLFNLPFSTNSDDQLLELLMFTFGLRLDKAKYTSRQLRNICSVAPQMMRNKGGIKAVHLLCTALMRADDIEGTFRTEVTDNGSNLIIYISSIASCKDIISEILPYILPAGMVFSIRQAQSRQIAITETLNYSDTIKYNFAKPTAKIKSLPIDTTLVPGTLQSVQQDNGAIAEFCVKDNLLVGLAIPDLTTLNDKELLDPDFNSGITEETSSEK